MTSKYHAAYKNWQEDPEAFWENASKEIDWFEPPKKIFNPEYGVYGRWFEGAICNSCYNAIDRHVLNGKKDQTALIYDSPVTGTKTQFSFGDLQTGTSNLAYALQQRGVTKGDRVLIYMPMVPEAIVAMLACARIGAIHSVVFGGFAANELATRIEDASPKVILSASCGIETKKVIAYKPLLDEAINLSSHKPDACIILQRPQLDCDLIEGRDVDYALAISEADKNGVFVECTPVAATDPLYILYTSGTTGQPKGVVRDNGGHMVALTWSMKYHYGLKPGDVFWAASDVGWVVGHSYICYGPLFYGCATVLYEGKPVGTPDASAFWRVIEDHKVTAMFTAPTAFRAVRKEDPSGKHIKNYDLSHFKTLFLAGERADPDTIHWAKEKLKKPVIDHWWQTETGWAITGNPFGIEELQTKPGSPGVPMPGYNVQVLDDEGQPVPRGTLGNIAIKLPLPPSCFTTLWNATDRFQSAYFDEFDGYYATSDAGIIDDDGYVFVMARTDDVINVAGHRLSTGAMEEVILSHEDVAECAVIGIDDKLKGQMPLGLFVLNDGTLKSEEQIAKDLIGLVREQIGPVAAFKSAIQINRLPKTRSGKVLRGTIQKIANKTEWKMPAAIDDPEILSEIEEKFRQM